MFPYKKIYNIPIIYNKLPFCINEEYIITITKVIKLILTIKSVTKLVSFVIKTYFRSTLCNTFNQINYKLLLLM